MNGVDWNDCDSADNNGQYDFHIDLGIALMIYGINTEWKDTTEMWPNFIRQTVFIPCNCDKGFIFVNDLTNRNAHWP